MKAIQIELPDKLASEINIYVNAGWFWLRGRGRSGRPDWPSSSVTGSTCSEALHA